MKLPTKKVAVIVMTIRSTALMSGEIPFMNKYMLATNFKLCFIGKALKLN